MSTANLRHLAGIFCLAVLTAFFSGRASQAQLHREEGPSALDAFAYTKFGLKDLEKFNSSHYGAACGMEDPLGVGQLYPTQEIVRSMNRQLVDECTKQTALETSVAVKGVLSQLCAIMNGEALNQESEVRYLLERSPSHLTHLTHLRVVMRTKFVPDRSIVPDRVESMSNTISECIDKMKLFFARYGLELDYKATIADRNADWEHHHETLREAVIPAHKVQLLDDTCRSNSGKYCFLGNSSCEVSNAAQCIQKQKEDFCLTMMHETGHTLGLDDEYVDEECPNRAFQVSRPEQGPNNVMEQNWDGWSKTELYPRHFAKLLRPVCESDRLLDSIEEKTLLELLSGRGSQRARDLHCPDLTTASPLQSLAAKLKPSQLTPSLIRNGQLQNTLQCLLLAVDAKRLPLFLDKIRDAFEASPDQKTKLTATRLFFSLGPPYTPKDHSFFKYAVTHPETGEVPLQILANTTDYKRQTAPLWAIATKATDEAYRSLAVFYGGTTKDPVNDARAEIVILTGIDDPAYKVREAALKRSWGYLDKSPAILSKVRHFSKNAPTGADQENALSVLYDSSRLPKDVEEELKQELLRFYRDASAAEKERLRLSYPRYLSSPNR